MDKPQPHDFDWDDIYTGTADDYEEPDALLLAIIDRLEPGTALDVGCGAGGLLVALHQRGWRVTGVDIAPRAIAAARAVLDARGVDADLVVADAATWRPAASYDLITNSFALPGSKAEQQQLFGTVRDALAPGGAVLLKDFDKPPTRNEIFAQFHCPSVEELCAAFDGFEILRAEIVETPVHEHSDPADRIDGPWTAVLFYARKPV